jgi:beta-glucosidase
VAIVAGLGLGAYRFSIEWARIEPERGEVSNAALDHYARVIDTCRAHGIAPVVTFHHFTQPRWMARLGGFAARDFPALFAEHCARTTRALDGIAIGCTINELNLPVSAARYFRARATAEQRRAAEAAIGAPLEAFFLFSEEEVILGNGLAAHMLARDAIKAERPTLPVGVTLAMSEETADAHPDAEAIRDDRRERYYAPFLDAVAHDDFVGVQNYSRNHTRADGRTGPLPGAPVTTMGWEDRPEALGEVCRWIARRWAIPMMVTENGYPGADDARRAAFIGTALAGLRSAISEGADVRGYFYWSLLDNFEWMLGYGQRFGLVVADRDTFERSVKPSARTLQAAALHR